MFVHICFIFHLVAFKCLFMKCIIGQSQETYIMWMCVCVSVCQTEMNCHLLCNTDCICNDQHTIWYALFCFNEWTKAVPKEPQFFNHTPLIVQLIHSSNIIKRKRKVCLKSIINNANDAIQIKNFLDKFIDTLA